jgi:hypothetical protein
LVLARVIEPVSKLDSIRVLEEAGVTSASYRTIERRLPAPGHREVHGMKVPDVPYMVNKWRREHPGEDLPDGHVFTQPWPAGPSSRRRDQVIYYSYKADRARRTLRGIDEQVAKAAKAVAGLAQTGWSIRKFVKTARRYRTIEIQAGQHTITAADPIPDDLRQALNAINAPAEVRTNLS